MSAPPNLIPPGRSACPGLGDVTAREFSSDGSVTQGFIAPSHDSHSALPTEMPTGAPVVRPFRIPPHTVSSSRSAFFRAPLPNPLRRLSRTEERSSRETERPDGSPSTMTRSPLPWDSPLVRNLQLIPQCSCRQAGPGWRKIPDRRRQRSQGPQFPPGPLPRAPLRQVPWPLGGHQLRKPGRR